MKDNNVAPSTLRARKSNALKAKRKKAAELGLTLIEGSLVAIRGDTLNVYQWDEATGDYVATHASKLVALD